MKNEPHPKRDKNAKAYTAVVIGAGRIAAGFDTPESKAVLTHAHALSLDHKIKLAGFYDIDLNKAREAGKTWSVKAFESLDGMMKEVRPDIVVICTPDPTHAEMLKRALDHKPRLVICEKPLTIRTDDSKDIVSQYKKAGIPLIVNYSRRFDETTRRLQDDLRKGKYGKVISAVGAYSRGILHNGSHMIDWARFLFGESRQIKALGGYNDYDSADITVSGFLVFERCPEFHLIAADGRCYSLFELEVIAEKGRIRLIDSGSMIEAQDRIDDPAYKGFTTLSQAKQSPTHLSQALVRLYGHVAAHLESGEALISSGEEALRTQEICQTLLDQYRALDK
ncbi:MAG: Gfo/Idh/MocA family oxidoreductase [Minisyncoccia bacterium]|jgi:predicted dehydrogenase